MIYRDNLFLNARFQEDVQAAHDQDWQTFEKYSFYDAKMMEDLLYKCEHLMPLEIKCRYALQHYYSHGDHSPIIRKYVRRAKIIRPDNWRDALPESVRDIKMFTVYRGGIGSIERAPLSISWSLSYDVAEWFAHRSELFYRCPCHVYQGTIHADKVIAYLPERSEFEIIQHRNVKNVQEITPLRGYSPPFNAFKSSKKWVHNEEQSSHKTVFAKVPAMGQIWRDFGHAFSFASSSSRGIYPSPSYLIWMCCTRFPLDLSGAST